MVSDVNLHRYIEEPEVEEGAADAKSSADDADAAAAADGADVDYAHLTDGVDEAFPRISPDGSLVQLRRSRSRRRRRLTGEAEEEAAEEEEEAEADGADTADLGTARDALRVVREKLVRGEVPEPEVRVNTGARTRWRRACTMQG